MSHDDALEAFFAAVPAAALVDEEHEVWKQWAYERTRAEAEELAASWMAWPSLRPRIWDLWSGAPTDDDDVEDEDGQDDEQRPVSRADHLQALALLERVLGATPIR